MTIEYENIYRADDVVVLLPIIGISVHPRAIWFAWLIWSVTVEFE